MYHINIFTYEESEIRTVLDKCGNPWWVASDVCAVLEITNHRDAIRDLDDDEKDCVGITDAIGRERSTNIVGESGLYNLIFKSRKPRAKKFKRWITHEVLPQIRTTGWYILTETIPDFTDPVTAARAWADECENKIMAQAEKRKAVREKAWIGSRREATAMATASKFVRKCERLAEQIGNSKTYKTIRAISWFKDYFEDIPAAYQFAGRQLCKLSRQMGYQTRDVEDTVYGIVKAYHIDIINIFRDKLDNHDFKCKLWRVMKQA